MPLPSPRRWREGDPFSAGHLNEGMDIVRALWPLTGTGLDVVSGTQGTTLISRKQRAVGGALPVPEFQGMVVMAVAQNQLGADFLFSTDLPL